MVILRPFTDEEFEIMIRELTDEENMSFDMMLTIAERVLRGFVNMLCYEDVTLRGRQAEDDVMQVIRIKLTKTCVTGFLIRENSGGGINRDPDGFASWLRRVAVNSVKDFAKAQRAVDGRADKLKGELLSRPGGAPVGAEARARLSEAFVIVFGLRKGAHILLTWIMQSLLMIRYDMTKIAATRLMAGAMSDRTLYEIWDTARDYLDDLPWIKIPDELKARMAAGLDSAAGGAPLGEAVYKTFFMKKGGLATISDWVNRVNGSIKSRMSHGTLNDR